MLRKRNYANQEWICGPDRLDEGVKINLVVYHNTKEQELITPKGVNKLQGVEIVCKGRELSFVVRTN
jgi:hypothetical protein